MLVITILLKHKDTKKLNIAIKIFCKYHYNYYFCGLFFEDRNMAKTSKTSNRRIVAAILPCFFFMMSVGAAAVHATHGNPFSHTPLHLHVLLAVTFTLAGVYGLVVAGRRRIFI
jgi:hypothetical protein